MSGGVRYLRQAHDSSDSDDDDTAELMAEIAKIKQERAEEKARLVSAILGLASSRPALRPFISELQTLALSRLRLERPQHRGKNTT